MPSWIERVSASYAAWRGRNLAIEFDARPFLGPLLIDRGNGLVYDIARNITWLKDANYAKTIGRSPDGQMTWQQAMAWVAGLNYRGIAGWRLPDARGQDGSGPVEGENCAEGEIGHLLLVAAKRKSPPDLEVENFEPYSIYWYRNEASAEEAFGFKMLGLKQGRMPKDPWGGELGMVLPDKVLTWPVHDGDVAPGFLVRFASAFREVLLRIFRP